MADDVTLVVGGQSFGGWEDISIDVGIESMPNKFDIKMSEKYPDQAADFTVQPGNKCTVMIGGDPVITGWVDIVDIEIGADAHSVRVTGRSLSCDLVDCSAEWPGGQIAGANTLGIAQKLAQPYGVTVTALVDPGPVVPQFNLNVTETAYAIIERCARWAGLLFYDQPDGTTVLNQAGSNKMASGISIGANGNAMRGRAVYSMAERYSTYVCFLQAMDMLSDAGDAGNLQDTQNDAAVTRHRLLAIVAEAAGGGLAVAKARNIWEMNRRAGRAFQISAAVDSWRDSGGTLWAPNSFIPVDAVALKAPAIDWVIGSAGFRRNVEDGTVCELTVMPKSAFLPEPILLQPFAADVSQFGGQ